MKNEKDEPKEYFERNILLVIIVTAFGVSIDYFAVQLLINVNPWGTALAIPGLVLTLQALWLIVNPYAIVYEDRFEVKQSLFYSKNFYFLDTKGATLNSNLRLIYNDDEQEKIPLLGIRSSHKSLFLKKLQEKIEISLKNRNF